MSVEVRFEIDDATLAALRMFAEYLDMSVEEYIEDYLEWEFSPAECDSGKDRARKDVRKPRAKKKKG